MASLKSLQCTPAERGWTPRVIGCLLLVVAIACGSPNATESTGDISLDWGPRADSLPSLTLVLDTEPPPPTLSGSLTSMAIDGNGSVLLNTDGSTSMLLAVIDTTGKLVRTFGNSGEGPGELRGAYPIGVAGGLSVIYDMRQLKLSLYDTAGSHVRSIRPEDAGLFAPKLIVNDSTALIVTQGPKGETLPAIMNLRSGSIFHPIEASDSFIQSMTTPPGYPFPLYPPTVGRWLGGFVLGDNQHYNLAFYDWQGHRLKVIEHSAERPRMTERRADEILANLNRNPARKPATGPALKRRREKLMKSEEPYFTAKTEPTIDYQGRLWILGQMGDSGYADLFGRDGYVGRLPLSCTGFKSSWALTGHWLAITCATDNPESTSGGVLKIFRIEG